MAKSSADDERARDNDGPGHLWVGRLAALLIGSMAGAVAMLLLAPRSGKRTRAKLHREGSVLGEQAADTVQDAVTQARAKTDQIAHDVHEQAVDLKKRGQAMLDGK